MAAEKSISFKMLQIVHKSFNGVDNQRVRVVHNSFTNRSNRSNHSKSCTRIKEAGRKVAGRKIGREPLRRERGIHHDLKAGIALFQVTGFFTFRLMFRHTQLRVVLFLTCPTELLARCSERFAPSLISIHPVFGEKVPRLDLDRQGAATTDKERQ